MVTQRKQRLTKFLVDAFTSREIADLVGLRLGELEKTRLPSSSSARIEVASKAVDRLFMHHAADEELFELIKQARTRRRDLEELRVDLQATHFRPLSSETLVTPEASSTTTRCSDLDVIATILGDAFDPEELAALGEDLSKRFQPPSMRSPRTPEEIGALVRNNREAVAYLSDILKERRPWRQDRALLDGLKCSTANLPAGRKVFAGALWGWTARVLGIRVRTRIRVFISIAVTMFLAVVLRALLPDGVEVEVTWQGKSSGTWTSEQAVFCETAARFDDDALRQAVEQTNGHLEDDRTIDWADLPVPTRVQVLGLSQVRKRDGRCTATFRYRVVAGETSAVQARVQALQVTLRDVMETSR